MDDADLEKLSIKPGSLNPKFHRNTTEYNVTLASDVGKLTISCLTSDSNASYQIVGGDGGRTVDLAEGKTTSIKIDVSAEDGTSKLYTIHAKRLSAKDASLMGIKIADGCLVPDFSPDTLNYSCILPYTASALKVTPSAPDKKNIVKVNGQDPGSEVNLNVGETAVEIEVTSADGSNKQIYTVNATKKWLGRAVLFADSKDAMKYECPITVSPYYKPCSIKGSDPKHVFSEPIIDELTRTSKVDPLDGTPLENEWKVPEGGLEKEMSGATVYCLNSYAGCEEKIKYSALGAHTKTCEKRPNIDADPENTDTCKECSRKLYKEEMEWHKSSLCTSKHSNRELKHSVKSHDWEKKLQVSEESGSVDQLMSKAKQFIKKYRSALPKKGQSSRFEEGGSPLDLLHTAAVNLACAIKQKPKQADLHFTLGLVLEETYYAQDMYGLKKDGGDGGRTVDLAEGKTTSIKIDVSAEDGTSKLYTIHAKRLSAKDASLMGIKIADGCLVPDFSPDTLNYSCILPYTASALKVTPSAPDKKNIVKVNGQDPGSEVNLNVGETAVEIEVTSADGSNKQIYTVNATKKWLGRAVLFADSKDAMKYECPITVSPYYKPCSIKGSDPKHVFSEPIIDELTRTSKVDPLDGTPLENEWKVPEGGLEKEMSGATVYCLYSYAGCEEKIKYSALGAHTKTCEKRPKIDADPENTDTCKECSRKLYKEEMEWHKSSLCTSKHSNRELKHSVKSHDWEKKLQVSEESGSVDQLMSKAKQFIKKYRSALPKKGQSSRFEEGGSPLDLLHTAAVNLACAIKHKPKQADLHFTLGLVLEETYYAQDMYGLKKDDDDLDDSMATLSLGLSTKSKDSSKEDDIQAICQQRGAGANAPLARQLQAIDEEYKHLLNSGQSQKSDYVQELYLFKSKQATQGGKTSQAASDESNPLGQACLKFMDALSLEQNNVMYNVHVGRLLLLQDKVDDALTRLQHAVGLKPFLPIARFYLGLTMVQQKNGPGARTKEAMTYINHGVQYLLELISKQAETSQDSTSCDLHSEDLWRSSSGQLLKGCIELGKLLKKTPTSGFLTAADVFHSAAILAGQNLCSLPSRGDTYQSMEWVLLDVHAILLEMLMEKDAGNAPWIAQRCQRLSSLVSCSTIPQSQQVLKLQEQTCQKGVIAQPCNSQALCHLGNSQLAMYENDPTSDLGKKALLDARLSFRSSIEKEGKPSTGGDLPAQLTEQGWWQEKKKKEEAAASKPAAAAAEKGKGVASKAVPARGAPAGRGTTPPRGTTTPRGTTRGGPAAARGGAAKAAPASRGGAARGRGTTSGPAKGAPARGRGGSTTSVAKPAAGSKAAQPSKAAPAPTKAVTTPSPEPSKEATAQPGPCFIKLASAKTTPVPANAPVNRMSHLPRLGLARALAKETEDTKESRMLYDDVITMAPQIHDAYIELAELLIKTEPLQAVDVYARYPFSEAESYDDAFLHGEILRLLMKHEKFDDKRLEKHMIAYGRILGKGCIEKYVQILEAKFKNQLLMNVYAAVNHKAVDDPDMQAFFKFKMWL